MRRRRRNEVDVTTGGSVQTAAPAPAGGILDQYVVERPSAQTALDVFAGEWSSLVPESLGVSGGTVPLFADPRITWLIEHIGGVDGLRVLELGPLEAGHTSMLDAAGAEVLAVEANTRAFLKCLIIKELLGLTRSRFVLGDFSAFLDSSDERFDLVVASGVLYHSPDPILLLERLAAVTDRLGIWTHYHDAEVVRSNPALDRMFVDESDTRLWRGLEVVLHRRAYLESLEWGGFCGGPESSALWMERDGLLQVLSALGFADITVRDDDPDHPNGPAILLCAQR